MHDAAIDMAIDAPTKYPLAFAPRVNLAADGPTAVVLADFNGDGKLDLAVADRSTSSPFAISVFLNTTAAGAQTPSFSPSADFPAGRLMLAVGDLNGDGRPDLAVSSQSDGIVSVLLNTTAPAATSATFASAVDFGSGGSTNPPTSVAIGDFDGDTKPDLAVVSLGNAVSVFLNTTPANAMTPSFSANYDFTPGGDQHSKIATGDFNGDGKPDLAVTSASSVAVLLDTTANGAAIPTFGSRATLSASASSGPESIAIGDFNEDGRPDLAVANSNSSSISVFLDTTAGGATVASFANMVAFADGTVANPQPVAVALGDLDGDGALDLAAANLTNFASNPTSGTVSILLNTTAAGATTPTAASQVDFATGLSPDAIAIGDLNLDGKPDLVVANYGDSPGSVSILLAK